MSVAASVVSSEQTARSVELALVAAAQAGDEAAFDALLEPRLGRLLRLCMSILANDADAQDAVQEACLHAWREIPRLRDPGRFEAWLWQIAVNACRTRLRGRRVARVREISVDDLPASDEPAHRRESSGDDLAAADAIHRAFARLDADKRTILILHHVDERSVMDIAALLGIPEGTAKWRLHAARRQLERALAEEAR